MNIAIWGAGKFGQYVFSQLKTNDEMRIICFIDNSVYKGEKKQFEEVPVVSPTVYAEEYAINTEIVLVAFVGSFAILGQLKSLGIKKFGFIYSGVYTYKLPLHDIMEQSTNIIWNDDEVLNNACMYTLETNVVDYCNLNCKGCSHFSNLFPKGSHIPFETFERDIKQLSMHVFIWRFNLLGGEIFLSDKVIDYIACLKRYMPRTKVELISNGLLIQQLKKEVLEYIRDNEVAISITEYPPTSTIMKNIKDVLEQYQILYDIRPAVTTFGKNIDISGKNEPKAAMQNCRESKCQFLRDGKIYKCPFAALGNYLFKYYEIPLHFHEGLDIFDNTLDWQAETSRLCSEPIAICRYCGKEERFPWESSIHPSKEDWII